MERAARAAPARARAARMADRALGLFLLVASSAGFAYYTAWTLLLPFVEPDQPLHALFPPRHLAVALPAAAVAVRRPNMGILCVRCARAHARRAATRQAVGCATVAYIGKVMLLGDGKRAKQARTRDTKLRSCVCLPPARCGVAETPTAAARARDCAAQA